MSGRGYYAFDLDGTLARYDEWRGPDHIGDPVPVMLAELMDHVNAGREVRIITARCSRLTNSEAEIDLFAHAWRSWCMRHLGFVVTAQSEKCAHMRALYDDRAIAVEKNTGRLLSPRI